MTLTPDFPSSPDDGEAKQFPDEDLSGLDFEVPEDFVVPDDISELETIGPATHHEDPDGTQWDDPEWLEKSNEVPRNRLDDFVPAKPSGEPDLDSELAEITGDACELAVVLTPVADAKALAAACALVGIDATAVPNPTGAIAVLKNTIGNAPERAVSALAGLLPSFPLLLITKATGQLTAMRYVGGQPPQEVPAGLVVAGASGVVEDLIIGQTAPDGVAGAVSSAGVSRAKAMMWLSKIAKHRRTK